jgi:hypothetical protein
MQTNIIGMGDRYGLQVKTEMRKQRMIIAYSSMREGVEGRSAVQIEVAAQAHHELRSSSRVLAFADRSHWGISAITSTPEAPSGGGVRGEQVSSYSWVC